MWNVWALCFALNVSHTAGEQTNIKITSAVISSLPDVVGAIDHTDDPLRPPQIKSTFIFTVYYTAEDADNEISANYAILSIESHLIQLIHKSPVMPAWHWHYTPLFCFSRATPESPNRFGTAEHKRISYYRRHMHGFKLKGWDVCL